MRLPPSPLQLASLGILLLGSFALAVGAAFASEGGPARLRRLATDYYRWRNEEHPVWSSDLGLHSRDDRLPEYSAVALRARRDRVVKLIEEVRGLEPTGWPRDDALDRILFLAQLEGVDFFDRVLERPETNPQIYVNECSNAIFSLLKKEYDTPRTRALAATARLRAMPALLEQGRRTLARPVRLYSRLAIESVRAMDELFGTSLMTLAGGLAPAERRDLERSRDRALVALRDFAAWLEQGLPQMAEFSAMGEAKYDWMLKHVYLLPLEARQVAMLGEAELARYRGLESLLEDPSRADPDPARGPAIEPAGGDDPLPARPPPRHPALRAGPLLHPPASPGLQAHEPGRVHERPRPLRPGPGRLLLHTRIRPDEPQLLHPGRHRGPAAHPGPRGDPRSLPPALDRQRASRRDPPRARGRGLH
ncbi:MAG: hypothetical protein DMF79_11275, partial [Acidobacteria bacterium]